MKGVPETLEILNKIYQKAGDIEIDVNCLELFPELKGNPNFVSRLNRLNHIKLIRFNDAYNIVNGGNINQHSTFSVTYEGLNYIENSKYIVNSLKKTDEALQLTRRSLWIALGALLINLITLIYMFYIGN